MMAILSVDDTHINSVANPSGLKKASGDSSAGVDVATINAVAASLVVNGMIDVSAIQMIERSTQSHLNNTEITSVSSAQKLDQRSDKINELALGMQTGNFQSMKVDSLGDMMCALMVLMIQSTSERKKMEREMRTLLVTSRVEQSEEVAKKIMEKMELDVERSRGTAISQVVSSAIGVGVSAGFAMRKTSSKSFTEIRGSLNYEQMISGVGAQVNTVGDLATLDNIKKTASLEADITRMKAAMTLTKSVADSVESSLKSIDSSREFFMSMMSQIAQAEHDAKMQIIRNSAI